MTMGFKNETEKLIWRVRTQRLLDGKSLRKAAEEIGISHTTLMRLESYRFSPRLVTWDKLASYVRRMR